MSTTEQIAREVAEKIAKHLCADFTPPAHGVTPAPTPRNPVHRDTRVQEDAEALLYPAFSHNYNESAQQSPPSEPVLPAFDSVEHFANNQIANGAVVKWLTCKPVKGFTTTSAAIVDGRVTPPGTSIAEGVDDQGQRYWVLAPQAVLDKVFAKEGTHFATYNDDEDVHIVPKNMPINQLLHKREAVIRELQKVINGWNELCSTQQQDIVRLKRALALTGRWFRDMGAAALVLEKDLSGLDIKST